MNSKTMLLCLVQKCNSRAFRIASAQIHASYSPFLHSHSRGASVSKYIKTVPYHKPIGSLPLTSHFPLWEGRTHLPVWSHPLLAKIDHSEQIYLDFVSFSAHHQQTCTTRVQRVLNREQERKIKKHFNQSTNHQSGNTDI